MCIGEGGPINYRDKEQKQGHIEAVNRKLQKRISFDSCDIKPARVHYVVCTSVGSFSQKATINISILF